MYDCCAGIPRGVGKITLFLRRGCAPRGHADRATAWTAGGEGAVAEGGTSQGETWQESRAAQGASGAAEWP